MCVAVWQEPAFECCLRPYLDSPVAISLTASVSLLSQCRLAPASLNATPVSDHAINRQTRNKKNTVNMHLDMHISSVRFPSEKHDPSLKLSARLCTTCKSAMQHSEDPVYPSINIGRPPRSCTTQGQNLRSCVEPLKLQMTHEQDGESPVSYTHLTLPTTPYV